jgi:hypothetical protein
MRTTVEIKPEHRAALLSLASRRGEKGFSGVLAEVIDSYLSKEEDRAKRRSALLALGGSITQEEADRLRRVSREIRESWR